MTEPQYLRAFFRWVKNPAVTVRVDDRSGDPRALMERALQQWAEDPDLDEVWCMFDVDEHAALPAVQEEAQRHGIRLAVSNPCFELWALLHIQDHGAHATCEDLSRRLRHHLGSYHKELPFGRLAPGYTDAVRRAGDLERRHERDGTANENPSTGVHHLTERIRQFGREERLSSG